MNKVMIAILKVLDKQNSIIGSREIARQLKLHGIDLTERTVRYHLKILDEKGYTEVFGKEGRRITEKGRQELQHALVLEKTNFVITKIETLSYLTTFNIDTMEGDVILNVSFIPEDSLDAALKIMKPVFSSPYIMSTRFVLKKAGERIGDIAVPSGKVGIGTVCSITINGILLKAGIPVTSRFGGILEIDDKKPLRFLSLISYEGSSLDPHEVFIRSKMTDVMDAVKKGRGKILASYREIPIVCLEKVKEISKILMKRGMGGILVIGSPNKPVLGIPPGIDRAGIVIAGGLNPVAALEESGIETESSAMSTLYPYGELKNFSDQI
ncbi:MAG: NrpR regulatory domain-containing protein [Thermodesulfovibrionales bacterium]|nr:NrpR regulatory domain-containing protein [Thermodesulfovibrionales bacterium]